jgi:glycosyltransferase involved in cell wall biosynthesis
MLAYKPLVTIGLLTYNQYRFFHPSVFHHAMESLVNLEYENKELIIFDDFSTDGTYELCQQYAEKYSFIKLFRQNENVGVLKNMAALLSSVSGDLFLYADPDDQYDKNYVTECVEQFEISPQINLVTTAVKTIYDNGDIYTYHYNDFLRGLPFWKMVRNILKSRDSLGNRVHYPPIIHGSLLRSSLISKIIYGEQFYGLEETWFTNALIWGDIGYIDKVLYFRSAFSISHSIRIPEIHLKTRLPSNQLIITIRKFICYYFSKADIPFIKKLRYVHTGLLFFYYRYLPQLKIDAKVKILDLIRKMGFMRYKDQTQKTLKGEKDD